MEGHPEGFGNLIELRYLDLSRCIDGIAGRDKVYSVLDRICALTNLEYLNISENMSISSIPEALGHLRKLHTLNLLGCRGLLRLPASISELDSLQLIFTHGCKRLEKSTVPQSKSESIIYPSQLKYGMGCPYISGLEKVKSAKEAQRIKFVNMTNISELRLEWTRDAKRSMEDEDVLRELDPPYSISSFHLRGYNSIRFPSWMMRIDAYLPIVTFVHITDLPNCNNLPPLGQLPNLQSLTIEGMDSIKEMGADLYGGPRAFPRLKCFYIKHMKQLEEWSTVYTSDEDGLHEPAFPCLDHVSISDCPKLRFKPSPPRSMQDKFKLSIECSDEVMLSLMGNIGDTAASTVKELKVESCLLPLHRWSLLGHLPCLRDLEIIDCSDLTCSSPDFFRDLTSLTELEIREEWREYGKHCRSLMSLPEGLGGLPSLRVLKISGCESIHTLPDSIQELTCLQRLTLHGCKSIVSLPEGLGDLTCLKELLVQDCKSIVSLPERLGDLTSLKELIIHYCEGIKTLPDTIEQLTCLGKLVIVGCPELAQWCKSKENKMKLEHINEILVDWKRLNI
ncbi:unnamed protein product [Urochloa humidicola]